MCVCRSVSIFDFTCACSLWMDATSQHQSTSLFMRIDVNPRCGRQSSAYHQYRKFDERFRFSCIQLNLVVEPSDLPWHIYNVSLCIHRNIVLPNRIRTKLKYEQEEIRAQTEEEYFRQPSTAVLHKYQDFDNQGSLCQMNPLCYQSLNSRIT